MGDSGAATTRERPLIDAAQQVSHLKDRGVRFELMDEWEAEQFLRESNFFFKMKAFARRFPCYANPGSKLGRPVGPISRMAVEQLGFDCELASPTKRAPIVRGFTVLASATRTWSRARARDYRVRREAEGGCRGGGPPRGNGTTACGYT